MLTKRVIAANPAIGIGRIAAVSAIIGPWAAATHASPGPGQTGAPERPVRVLDIGAGPLDSPLAILHWMRGRGIPAEVTAIVPGDSRAGAGEDVHDLRVIRADARNLMDHFDADMFDAVHAGFCLHRLPDIEVMTVLRIMDRLSRGACAWSDFARALNTRLSARLRNLFASSAVRQHALAINSASFARSEAVDLARRTGWEGVRYRRFRSGRFLLTSEPEARNG